MIKAITNAWKTLTDSLRVLGQHRRASFYPLLSIGIMLGATFAAVIPLLENTLEADQSNVPARVDFFLVVYLAYGLQYFVSTFCNVALITVVAVRLDGSNPGLAAGLKRAAQRLGLIGVHTLVSATLGLVSFLARVLINPIFGMVIAPAIGKRWWLHRQQLSYNISLLMEVPVIALDQPAPKNAFKRAELLVKETWGERVNAAHGIGLLALLVLLPALILFAMPALRQGVTAGNADQIRLGLSVLLVSILTFTQINALVNAIFALAAYRYATDRTSDVFPGDASYAEHAFVKPKKEPTSGIAPADSPSVTVDGSSN